MYILILSIILVIAVLLVLVVLAQNPKGGGLSSQFGGGAAGQVMGVKKTSDLLEKLTWGFIIAIMALTISTKFFIGGSDASSNPLIDKVKNESGGQQAIPDIGGGQETPDFTAPSDSASGN